MGAWQRVRLSQAGYITNLVLPFNWTQRIVEHLSLAGMIFPFRCQHTSFHARLDSWVGLEAAWCLSVRARWIDFEAVGPIVHGAFGDCVLALAVTVEVQDWADWPVDGQLLPVDAETRQLSVEVREIAPCEQWIWTVIDTFHDVGGAESDLFGLREVLINVAIQLGLANIAYGHLYGVSSNLSSQK